jgi:hypothetical protein
MRRFWWIFRAPLLAGRAVSGPLQGAQMPAVPSKTSFWFAIIAAEPEITVYQADG